jgi:hypothetical protein
MLLLRTDQTVQRSDSRLLGPRTLPLPEIFLLTCSLSAGVVQADTTVVAVEAPGLWFFIHNICSWPAPTKLQSGKVAVPRVRTEVAVASRTRKVQFVSMLSEEVAVQHLGTVAVASVGAQEGVIHSTLDRRRHRAASMLLPVISG